MFNKISSLMAAAAALTVSGTNLTNPSYIYNLEWQPPIKQTRNRFPSEQSNKCKKGRAKNKVASVSRKHNRQRRKRGLHA